jgi:hypothetical protein
MLTFSRAYLTSVLPCALAASPWQCLHPHGLSLQSRIASSSCGVPLAMLALSQASVCPIDDQAAIAIGLPLLSGCHHCRAAIVVGLPSSPYSLGPPPNALFVVVVGLHCCPILLGCLQMPRSSLPLGCHCRPCCVTNLSVYTADPHRLFIHLVCCFLFLPCPARTPLPQWQTTCLSHGPLRQFK